MARKKTSPAEDLLSVVSLLPWWAGVALAVLSYAVLHRLAMPGPAVAAVQPGQIGGLVVRSMGTAAANIGQYLLPLICLGGAFVSFWRRRQRKTLVADVVQTKGASALGGMSWREFEMLVGEAFRLQGYRVEETGGGGADGGVDLVLSKGTEKFLVQCKQWKAFKVGVAVVRELYGVMAAKGAAGGFVVTSGTFTEDAIAFASGRNVKLVDGVRLFGLIAQARQSIGVQSQASAQEAPSASRSAGPSCPVCTSAMVKRTAMKGAKAGSQFWVCSRFPGCRGTLPA
jgi:restriction system protein